MWRGYHETNNKKVGVRLTSKFSILVMKKPEFDEHVKMKWKEFKRGAREMLVEFAEAAAELSGLK